MSSGNGHHDGDDDDDTDNDMTMMTVVNSKDHFIASFRLFRHEQPSLTSRHLPYKDDYYYYLLVLSIMVNRKFAGAITSYVLGREDEGVRDQLMTRHGEGGDLLLPFTYHAYQWFSWSCLVRELGLYGHQSVLSPKGGDDRGG